MMNEATQFQPKCSVCGRVASTTEIIPPANPPVDWDSWPEERRKAFEERRDATQTWLLYSGPGGSNGWIGDPITPEEAEKLIAAFEHPSVTAFLRADLYDCAGFCGTCEQYYCDSCWNISDIGGGDCPKGHFKSLDPHWSPDD